MKQKNTHRHCPEVEDLIGGNMPFVTRWGITLVALVIFIVAAGMALSDGTHQQLVKDMLSHVARQVMSRY